MSAQATDDPRGILIVDLGAQYAQLIARKVRECQTWCEIAPPRAALETAKRMNLGGVILSGGPASVYADDAPDVPAELLSLGVPVLGICDGMQWMCRALDGVVVTISWQCSSRSFASAAGVTSNPSAVASST